MARGWFFYNFNYLFAFFWRNLNGVKQALIDSLFYLTACIKEYFGNIFWQRLKGRSLYLLCRHAIGLYCP